MTSAERAELARRAKRRGELSALVRQEASASAFKLWEAMWRFADHQGYLWPSAARLLTEAGIKKDITLYRARTELKQLGVLNFKPCVWVKGGHQAPTLYRVGGKQVEELPERYRGKARFMAARNTKPPNRSLSKQDTPAVLQGVEYCTTPPRRVRSTPNGGVVELSQEKFAGGEQERVPISSVFSRSIEREVPKTKTDAADDISDCVRVSHSLSRMPLEENKKDGLPTSSVEQEKASEEKPPVGKTSEETSDKLLQEFSVLLPLAFRILKKTPLEFAADWEDWQFAYALVWVWRNKVNSGGSRVRSANYFVMSVCDLSEKEQAVITNSTEGGFLSYVETLRMEIRAKEKFEKERKKPS
jgi:hypothetical protein